MNKVLKIDASFDDITDWLANKRETNTAFNQWYMNYRKVIEQSLSVIHDSMANPDRFAVEITEDFLLTRVDLMHENRVFTLTPKQLFFEIHSDYFMLRWQIGYYGSNNNTASFIDGAKIDGIVHPVLGMYIEKDEEIVFAERNPVEVSPFRHCTTGPYHMLNGRVRYLLWGEEIDPKDYQKIVETKYSLEYYKKKRNII